MSNRIRSFAVALAAVAAPSFAGLTFTQVMTSEGGQRGGAGMNMTTSIQVDNGQARMEMKGLDNPMMPAGSYILVKNGGDDVFLVKPSQKTYARFDPASMLGGADTMMDQMMKSLGSQGCSMEIEKPTVEKQLEEAGPDILGYPTKHFRMLTTNGWKLDCTGPLAMNSMSNKQETVEDIWTTASIDAGAMAKFFGNFGGAQVGGKFKAIADAGRSKITGFPLRRIATSKGEMTGFVARMGGGPHETKMTTEVKEVKTASIPGSVFEIPAGFTETQMMQKGPAMPDINNQPPH